VALLLVPLLLPGQSNLLSVIPPPKLAAKRNSVATARIAVQLRSGYHVNSNTPADDYLIPLRLTWTAAPLEVEEIVYPKPRMEKYEFSEKPLSVYTGDFEIITRFRVPASAPPGMRIIDGRLRYQACSHKECYPPRTVDVKLAVDVLN
jgi:hypothetical protein